MPPELSPWKEVLCGGLQMRKEENTSTTILEGTLGAVCKVSLLACLRGCNQGMEHYKRPSYPIAGPSYPIADSPLQP